jgi:hypothetical protein
MRGQVKGQAGEAERLVCRKGCPLVLSGDFPRNRGECFLHVGLLVRMPKMAVYPVAIGGTLKEKPPFSPMTPSTGHILTI